MAKLSKQEQELMERLQSKMEAPDEPPMNKSVSFSIDLADDNQIKRAQKLGLLPSDFDDDDGGDGDGDGDGKEPDDKPKRRGYFKDE